MSFIPVILGIVIGLPLTVYLAKTFIDNNDQAKSKYSYLIGTSFDEATLKNKHIILVKYPYGLPPNLAWHYTTYRINVKTDDNNIITEIISCG